MLSQVKAVSTGDDEVRGRYASSVLVVLGIVWEASALPLSLLCAF